MSENKMATKEDLKEFYNRIYPYLGGSAAAGFTPIGTIIPMIAETAPANYLICDGAAYNKSDYPELANHLLFMTNHSMYEVSGDSTKFKVPDLRGEFIRMTGTNSHANQGSGADVGVHQNATEIQNLGIDDSGRIISRGKTFQWTANTDSDGSAGKLTTQYRYASSLTETKTADIPSNPTVRPTNTSVLFCIATKNIYLNPSLDYSTDEKVVGTWIDGKPLYQKTIVGTLSTFTDGGYNTSRRAFTITKEMISSELEEIIDCKGKAESAISSMPYMGIPGTNSFGLSGGNVDTSSGNTRVTYSSMHVKDKIHIMTWSGYNMTSIDYTVTVQYTKTTS